MDNILISLMITYLLFGFKVFDFLKSKINNLLLLSIFIISYSLTMNVLFKVFEWKAIIFFFIPAVILWAIDSSKYND